jgi:tRNA A37 threonylcarbamoyladenosine dehydratase
MAMKQWRKTTMNDKLRTVLKKRYEADIADAKYKIKCFSEHELVIPEHPDITLEVDKLLQKIAEAEDKLAVMRLHYDENKAESTEYKIL